MKIYLNRDSSIPLYLQIVNQIKKQILSGELPVGYKLPPERRLAENLAVNRTTILNAYRELKAENLIGSHVGKGTVVLSDNEQKAADHEQKAAWNHFFSEYSSRISDHVISDLLAIASRRDVISFATGIAAPDCETVEVLKGIEDDLTSDRDYQALLHSPVEGFVSLRKMIASYMGNKGTHCCAEEVMVLSGSQQGIDLAARVFIDPGDIVIMEDPTFFPALKVFRMAGARVIGVPMDQEGMKMDLLEQLLERYRPKIIYTIPSFHNPTGIEMSFERRKRLLELVHHFKVPIIEDDAYGDICFDEKPLPTLKSMDHSGFVIYLNTFSKIIYPGLRIGWTVADRRVVDRFAAVRQIVDLHTNCISQKIIEKYLASGKMEAHLKYICTKYKKRRDQMYSALVKYAANGMEFWVPNGGYYVWCRLPQGVKEADLVKKASRYGVVFLPGSLCFVEAPKAGYIRLNFTFESLDKIEKGIKNLCLAVTEIQNESEQLNLEQLVDLNPIV